MTLISLASRPRKAHTHLTTDSVLGTVPGHSPAGVDYKCASSSKMFTPRWQRQCGRAADASICYYSVGSLSLTPRLPTRQREESRVCLARSGLCNLKTWAGGRDEERQIMVTTGWRCHPMLAYSKIFYILKYCSPPRPNSTLKRRFDQYTRWKWSISRMQYSAYQ